MRSADQIVQEYHRRRDDWDPQMARMAKVRDTYNGDLVVPVDDDLSEPAVANLILTGVDQTAARIASVQPAIYSPPVRPGFEAAERRAQDRTDVLRAWWQANRMPQRLRTRARYLIAYGTAPVVLGVGPDDQPIWRIRNPLQVFPSGDLEDEIVPADVVVAIQRPASWVRERYPEQAMSLDRDLPPTAPVTLLEYTDADQVSLVLCGGRAETQWWDTTPMATKAVMLENIPNRVGRSLCVIPSRPTLDRVQGQFDQMIGMHKAQARLMALSIIATDKAVFPDTYLVSRPGEVARFVTGPFDGRSGEVNIIAGGDVTELQSAPGMATNPTIDRLERNQRITAAVPPEYGGESTSNIRTGRRGDAVLSAVIDFPIMEAQEALAEALTTENKIAAAISKAYVGDKRVTVYYTMRGKPVGKDFNPVATFDTDHNIVSYPVSGADMNSLVVGMGQRIGLGIMSKRTAAELDPLIEDPERENDRITGEQLDAAVLASLQQAATTGQMPPQVVARVAELVRRGNKDLVEAVETATQEYQAAQQAAQQAPMGMPPAPAEGLPSVAEAPQGMQNLAGLLRSIRNTTTYEGYQEGTGQPVRRAG